MISRSEGVIDMFQLAIDNGKKPNYKEAAALDSMREAVDTLRSTVADGFNFVDEGEPQHVTQLQACVVEVNAELKDTLALILTGPLTDPANQAEDMMNLLQKLAHKIQV